MCAVSVFAISKTDVIATQSNKKSSRCHSCFRFSLYLHNYLILVSFLYLSISPHWLFH